MFIVGAALLWAAGFRLFGRPGLASRDPKVVRFRLMRTTDPAATIDSAALRGRALAIFLWSPGCRDCTSGLREVEGLARRYAGRHLAVFTVISGRARPPLAPRPPLPGYDILRDRSGRLGQALGHLRPPALVLLDARHRLAQAWAAPPSRAVLDPRVESLILDARR